MTTNETLVLGREIQIDRSGVGHAWVRISADDCPPSIVQEIEAEIIDGGNETCEDYLATNGQHYRW
jgi:hypothetical protein